MKFYASFIFQMAIATVGCKLCAATVGHCV